MSREIRIVGSFNAQGGELASLDEVTLYLRNISDLSSFHQSLPDELQRQLRPFLKSGKHTYLNEIKNQLKTEKWSAQKIVSPASMRSYKSAHYPNFHQEPQLSSLIPSNDDSDIDTRPELEYEFELLCDKAAFKSHVGWDFILTKAGDEPNNMSWLEKESDKGFVFLAKTKEPEPRTLTLKSKNVQMPLSIPNVMAKPKGEGDVNDAFIAVMPSIQFGERLGLPTQGYYYHFNEGKLVQEYKILGEEKSLFYPTYSDENTLTDEGRESVWQSAIPVYWRINGERQDKQHLMYLPNKLSQYHFNNINEEWLNKNALALDIEDLVKVGKGNKAENEHYHLPSDFPYQHPGRLLHGTDIVAINSSRMVSSGVPVLNLRPEKIYRIGVFFDGTGNNDKNDAYKELRGNKSRSNVARLFAAYPQVKGESTAIYVSGVGTVDIEDDNERPAIIDAEKDETKLEQAFGVNGKQTFGGDLQAALALGVGGYALLNYLDGENGAFYKWQSLLSQLRREIDLLGNKYDEYTHIAFDVFGFSRGAALSRHFVNTLYQGLPDYSQPVSGTLDGISIVPHLMGDETNEKFSTSGGYERDKSKGVSVRFLGLFDTVGSFYLAGNDKEGNFELGVEPTMAGTVLQLTAEHEYRKNFPLTSLTRDNWLPDNFYQERFPGCHTDVGGGYPSIKQYDKKGLPEYVGFPVAATYNRQLVKTQPLDIKAIHFAYRGGSVDKKAFIQRTLSQQNSLWAKECLKRYGHYGEVKELNEVLYYYQLEPVSNAIAGLALERMKQQSENSGVQWTELDYAENLTPDYKDDPFCQSLWCQLEDKPIGTITPEDWICELEPKFHQYIHRSHDTVLNPPYKTLIETLVNSFTTDKETGEKPERRIWDNE